LIVVGSIDHPDSISDVMLHYRVGNNYRTATVIFASRYVSKIAFQELSRVAWPDIVTFLGM
jgi:hypothetical protein